MNNTKYEYKVLSGTHIDFIREDINEFGKEGWRVIKAELDIENNRGAVILERKLCEEK